MKSFSHEIRGLWVVVLIQDEAIQLYKENFNMRLFFWDFVDYNDIGRQWAMFVINFLAFLFTSISLYKTARYHGKVMFELLPLSINTFATLILLFIKLFEKGYEFDLIGYIIEIFTYFLFCYTFALMHTRLIATHRLHVKKVCNLLFILIAVMAIVGIALILSSVIARNCDNNMMEVSIAGFVTELVSYIPTIYFGWDILKDITRKHEQEKEESYKTLQSPELFKPVSDQYIKERKKQIQLVLLAYTLSLLLRAIVLGFNFNWDDYFICTECEGVYIVTSDRQVGQFMLILIEINQLIPHLIIPIALYVIPVKKNRKSIDVHLLQTMIDEDQEQVDHSDAIQRRVSSSILNRNSPKKNSEYDNE